MNFDPNQESKSHNKFKLNRQITLNFNYLKTVATFKFAHFYFFDFLRNIRGNFADKLAE